MGQTVSFKTEDSEPAVFAMRIPVGFTVVDFKRSCIPSIGYNQN
jgi:hypothetical protein